MIEFKEDPKIIDANSEFLKKLKFLQYSDIHSKKFLNLLPEKKNFQLLIKKLQDNPIISGQEITLIDQKGQPLNANINLELQYLDNNSPQIAGQVFFLD